MSLVKRQYRRETQTAKAVGGTLIYGCGLAAGGR